MICPECGTELTEGLDICPECGAELPKNIQTDRTKADVKKEWESTLEAVMRVIVNILASIFSLTIVLFGLYKGYFWWKSISLQHMYENGSVQVPLLEEITMNDGRDGHAITFYGKDGDIIYIEELNKRFMVVGGKAVVEVADAEWFQMVNNVGASAQIYLTAVQTTEKGEKTLLPVVSFDVEMPVSPLTITSPKEKYVTTMSSAYDLKMNVVYGSTVLVDGEDVTSMVDRQGNLTVSVAVYPQGENPISILVQTPNHFETREDLVFYRQPMDIDLEVAFATSFVSEFDTMTIRGAVDPTAQLAVESNYLPETLQIDEKGNYSFAAYFDHIGYNTVAMRATKPGCQDSELSFDVYYVPSENEYSRKAWSMDYQNLLYCWDQWNGRIFRCAGSIVAFDENDPNTFIIDVSGDESGKYLVIENMSDQNVTQIGDEYVFFADVSGQGEYLGKTYTKLVARYGSKVD